MRYAILAALLAAAAPAAQAQDGAMRGMDHGSMPAMQGMDHGSMDHGSMPAAHGHGTMHGAAPAGDAPAPEGVTVQDCWIRLLPGTVPSAGYFVVKNAGAQPVSLTGVHAEAFGMAMLHQTRKDDSGMTGMAMVDAVQVPAGGELSFSPGGYHVMLEKPVRPLQVGATVPLTLSFDGGRALTAQCGVRPPGAMGK